MQMHPRATIGAGSLCFSYRKMRREAIKENGCEAVVLESGDISNSNLCKPSIAENISINYDIVWRNNHFGAEWGLLIRIILYCFHTAVKKHLNASEFFIFWENIWTLKRNLYSFIPSSNKCECLAMSPKLIKAQSVHFVDLLWYSDLGVMESPEHSVGHNIALHLGWTWLRNTLVLW